MERLPAILEKRLIALGNAMVDQHAARVLVAPQAPQSGFWFGGGNLVKLDDALYLVGRYRNQGDSRTGLQLGQRGLELALFRAAHKPGKLRFEKLLSWEKSDLNVGDWTVLSIEGSALWRGDQGWELYVSTEKQGLEYPAEVADFLKPGAGVWTIERLTGATLDDLRSASPEVVMQSSDPRHLHVKDPNLHATAHGDMQLIYCTHPFNWASSNTAFAQRAVGSAGYGSPVVDAFPRGTTWDVAMTRTTCVVDVPIAGAAGWEAWNERRVSLVFYDGGESLRPLDEHGAAVRRPRGYSCEELGGLAYVLDDNLFAIHRLSVNLPQFVSPYGTGCSRYVQSIWTDHGYITTWQQSQADLSQPLVGHELSADAVAALLGGETL